MIPPPLPPDESRRLQALRRLGLLDTPAEERFDRIVRMAARTFRALLDTFARDAQLAPILDRLAEDFVTSRRPAFHGCLQEALDTPPSIESTLAPRPDLIYRVRHENERLVLLFGSTEIDLPAFTRDAVIFALDGAPFVVRDLPGQLDDAGKLVLAQRLLREGLLVRQDEASR